MKTNKQTESVAAIEAAIDEYQKNERPRLREHLQTMNVLQQMQLTTLKGRQWLIKQHLKESGADKSLKDLAEKGCDRGYVIDLLAMMDSHDLPPRWLGFADRRELERALKKLREAEQVVDRIQRHTSVTQHLAHHWVWFSMFPVLPRLLESYCTFVELFFKSEGRGADPIRELFVLYVMDRTGTPCDREVAALIAALPDHRGYSTEAHAKWRSRSPFLEQHA